MASGSYEYQSDFARRYVAQGKAEGKAEGEAQGKAAGEAHGRAESVLRVLAVRSIDVPAAIRERILACTDLVLLDVWLARAVAASSASNVVADE
jgi:hypothetical protein